MDLFITPCGGNTLYRPKTYSLNPNLGRYYFVQQAINTGTCDPTGGRGGKDYTVSTSLGLRGQLRVV